MSAAAVIGASLPPQVEGQLRCFLSLKLGELAWNIPRPPKDIQVRIRWWGQTGNSAILRPKVCTDPNYLVAKNKHSEVHYPVRCGPRQFEAYLKDMGSLQLDVIFGPSCTNFAHANVDIASLSSMEILDRCYPLLCTTPAFKGKEVGSLCIIASFKSIADTYNVSSSIIPTTDREFQQPAEQKETIKKSQPSAQSITLKTTKNKDKKICHLSSKKRDAKDIEDIDFVVGPGKQDEQAKVKEYIEYDSEDEIVQPFVARNIILKRDKNKGAESSEEVINEQPVILKGEQRATVLSSLLQKTEQLRDSMVKHTLSSQEVTAETKEPKKPAGLINELLNMEVDESYPQLNISFRQKDSAIHEMEKLDSKVVDLLLGSEEGVEKLLRQVDMSLDSNFSILSDDQDPLHDPSLLDQLLYTTIPLKCVDESSVLLLDESEHQNENTGRTKYSSIKESSSLYPSCEPVPLKEVVTCPDNDLEEVSTFDSITTVPIESERLNAVNGSRMTDCISVENLTQLGRVKSVKVVLKEFSLCTESLTYGQVYFVEFRFPVSTGENHSPLMEKIQHVSRQVNNVAEFGRFSIFPIIFNEEMVELWWQKSISFTIYVKYDKQEKPEWLGEGYLKLREVLLGTKINPTIDIYSDKDAQNDNGVSYAPIGRLKLFCELSTDHGKSSAALMNSYVGNTTPILKEDTSEAQYPLTPIKISTKLSRKRISSAVSQAVEESQKTHIEPDEETKENVFLHNLIIISSGTDIVNQSKHGEDLSTNSYVICRVFWNNDELKSNICWNTNQPHYKFQQALPMSLTKDLIHKMENNFLIIEVWHKSPTTESDNLLGMGKVSLQQFYLSYKDPVLTSTILKSKYPVIAHDGAVPVMNIFSSGEAGSLDVLLALGTHDQVTEVLQMKNVGYEMGRQRKTVLEDEPTVRIENGMVEHQLKVMPQSLTHLLQDDGEVWGESDCYVQYHFPEQIQANDMKMSVFKTQTTLSLPNPVFGQTFSHRFYLKKDVPLQKLLFDSFRTMSPDILFEIRKRHYYPNVRDHLVAKAHLPLAKVCAMITMDTRDSEQSFHLPLVGLGLENENGNNRSMLDVKFDYKLKTCQENYVRLPSEVVCLSVSVHRLCGLKVGLAKCKNKLKQSTSANSSGLNVFVKIHLSFLGRSSLKLTNVVANTFTPVFSHHVDFSLPLRFGDQDETSLAEMLENGDLIFEIVHQFVEADLEDVLLFKARIPLVTVLTKCTGIKGWWPLTLAEGAGDNCHDSIAGGIEISSTFLTKEDREKIINNGRGMGWSPLKTLPLHEESWFPIGKDKECKPSTLNIHVGTVSIPEDVIANILCKFAGLKHHFETIYCRYKFYNKPPIYSKSAKLTMQNGFYCCSLSHASFHEVAPNTSLAWYLREELLEVQFWLSWSNYTVNDTSFTRQKDRLVGSAFVEMSSFSHSPYDQKVVSSQFPLFNANSVSICQASARISISFNTEISKDLCPSSVSQDISSDVSCVSSGDDEDILLNDICRKKVSTNEANDLHDTEEQGGEKMSIQIEEAMHLLKSATNIDAKLYVTYTLPNCRLVYTNFSTIGKNCAWNFQKQHKMDFESLKGKNLIFYLWNCCGEKQNVDRDVLIGTAAVDTAPLFFGLKQIIGWYNVQDLQRQIIGQIKLGVLPATSLAMPVSPKYFQNLPARPSLTCTKSMASHHSFIPQDHPSRPTYESKSSNVNSKRTSDGLFEKLSSQLQDLQMLTRSIQQRVCADHHDTLTNDKCPENIVVEHKQTEKLEENHNTNEDSWMLPAEIDNNLADEVCNNSTGITRHEPCIAMPSEFPLAQDSTAQHSGSVDEDKIMDELIMEPANFDRNDENDDALSCGSTDNLLDDLKKFEDKFISIKKSLEGDYLGQDDSWLSDNEVIDVRLEDIPKATPSIDDFVTDDIVSGNSETSVLSLEEEQRDVLQDEHVHCKQQEERQQEEQQHVKQLPEQQQQELHSQGGDQFQRLQQEHYQQQQHEQEQHQRQQQQQQQQHQKQRILEEAQQIKGQYPVPQPPLKEEDVEQQIQQRVKGEQAPDIMFQQQLPQTNIMEDEDESVLNVGNTHSGSMDRECSIHPSPQHIINDQAIPEVNGLTKSNQISDDSLDSGITNLDLSCDLRRSVQLPNFFMAKEELAESMQALRLAAKLRQSPRCRRSYNEEDTRTNRSAELSSKGNLKEKISERTVPGPEMARIAHIFASNSKGK